MQTLLNEAMKLERSQVLSPGVVLNLPRNREWPAFSKISLRARRQQ
jgi:hypothetical protein